jgi:hypothetical protein
MKRVRREWKAENIRLCQSVGCSQREVLPVRINGFAQINGSDPRAPIEQNFRKPTGTAPHFEHLQIGERIPNLVSDCLLQPIRRQRQSGMRIELRAPIAIPLDTKACRISALGNESGNAVTDLERLAFGTA